MRSNTSTDGSVLRWLRTASGLCAAVIVLSGCELFEPPAPVEDPMAVRLDELERRLAALERVLASGSLIDLTVQVDDLQRQTSDLQGRTETLEYGADGTLNRQRDLYADLDDRIRELERSARAPAPVAGIMAPVSSLPVDGGSDRENYEAAFELLKEQRYAEAGTAFQQFLRAFPDSQLADNAQYWLAEAYYVTDQFETALGQFQVVINNYPRSRKMPDAFLKIGYSNYELERWDAARDALQRVRDDFSDSTAARLAEQRLQRMRDEGH